VSWIDFLFTNAHHFVVWTWSSLNARARTVSWLNVTFLSPFSSCLISRFNAQGLPQRGSSEPGVRWKKNWMKDHQTWINEMFDPDSMNPRKEVWTANGLTIQCQLSILGAPPKVVSLAITVHRVHWVHRLHLSHSLNRSRPYRLPR